MKLASFDGGFGRVEGDSVVPMGEDLVAYLATGVSEDRAPVPLAGLALRSPVVAPQKVICVGLNYHDHAEETGQPVPEEPILFPKFANSVIGHGADVVVPPVVTQPDFEAELGVVIGRRARARSPRPTRSGHVAGYTCVNDVLGARPAVPLVAVDAGQGGGHLPAVRPLARHDGRDPRSASARDKVPGQRGSAAGFVHRADDLRRGDPGGVHQPHDHVGTRRHDRDRHPARRGDGPDAAPLAVRRRRVTISIERIGALTNQVRAAARNGGPDEALHGWWCRSCSRWWPPRARAVGGTNASGSPGGSGPVELTMWMGYTPPPPREPVVRVPVAAEDRGRVQRVAVEGPRHDAVREQRLRAARR